MANKEIPAITIIGSRNTNQEDIKRLQLIAAVYNENGYTLRSGGAVGADSAINGFDNVQIFIPWNGYNDIYHNPSLGRIVFDRLPNSHITRRIIAQYHDNPGKLSPAAWKLHQRNVYQIFGPCDLANDTNANLSKHVYYCAPSDSLDIPLGGTRTAILIARQLDIPTTNIYNMTEGEFQEVLLWVEGELRNI